LALRAKVDPPVLLINGAAGRHQLPHSICATVPQQARCTPVPASRMIGSRSKVATVNRLTGAIRFTFCITSCPRKHPGAWLLHSCFARMRHGKAGDPFSRIVRHRVHAWSAGGIGVSNEGRGKSLSERMLERLNHSTLQHSSLVDFSA
jgi:hypothetical protein